MNGKHSHCLPTESGISGTLDGTPWCNGSLPAKDPQLQQGPLQMSRTCCFRPCCLLDLRDLLWQAFL